jgi:hypothetical protein
MANVVKLKRSAVPGKTPATTDLDLGELAINTYDGKVYLKKDNGTPAVVELGTGPTGAQGPAGDDGVGIPEGGTTGQVLAKASGDDYDTEWVTPSSGGVTTGKAIAMAIVFGG